MQTKHFLALASIILACSCTNSQRTGETEITAWQNDKSAAISLTFDDGSPNQFSQALPILNKLNIPATFYIITGNVAGSQYHGKFIGRPVSDIIKGTADTLTNKKNFFERASAIPFLGYKGTLAYHTDAGTLYEEGKLDEAYHLVDSGYKKIRNGEFKPADPVDEGKKHLTWQAIKHYAAQGHEFASHTITHPRLAVLTEPNILYELEKSKEEISKQIGERYAFSAECPYGTEDERVMSYAYKIYPALRNRMPEKYLGELNRASKTQPGTVNKEYVQWQRGATTKTPLPLMKSWVDTVASHNNNWLVLVFHGVDGVGWEALPHEMLQEYFKYIKQHEDRLWIATFADVTKYMRERMHATITAKETGDKIMVDLTHSLEGSMYDIPLTVRTYVPANWKQVQVKQGDKIQTITTVTNDRGTFVLYQLKPNGGTAELSGGKL
jgi:peptidoglycan/xylan/chitin deacetylase (PgdA/CDA1 family)